MIIPAKPYPKLRDFLSPKIKKTDKWDNFYFFLLGRHALLSGAKSLGLKKNDSIIFPAYICSSAYEPLKQYGLNIILIDVDEKLEFSSNQLKKVILEKKPKAIVIIHYFGIIKDIQSLVKLCNGLNVRVIEDYSQSFFSALPHMHKNLMGDIAIFSIRKSLPIIDGGALCAKAQYNFDKEGLSPASNPFFYLIIRTLERLFILIGVNIYKKSITKIKENLRKNSKPHSIDTALKGVHPSWLLEKYLNNQSYLEISEKRIKANFVKMSQIAIKFGFRLFISPELKNFSPQALIIYDDIGGLTDHLRKNGVGACGWPENEIPQTVIKNPQKFLNSIYFNKRIVLIPIHQDISASNIELMKDTLNKWVQIHSKVFE